jgi:4-hydroxy-tetrahydrodipicolinate synthase
MSLSAIRGIIGYLVTPFGPAGDGIDEATLRLLVDHLVSSGVHAISPLGSTGESAYLTPDEWLQVAQISVSATAGRVPTVVGASALTTHQTIGFARTAEEIGADAVMVLPISYWKLSEAEIFAHYAAVSDAISIPIMAYNNPATSGIDMRPALLARMVREIENVTMVKESSGDIQRMHALHDISGGTIPFFNGSNPLALEALVCGASGWCTAAPNLIPKQNLALWDAVSSGDLHAAKASFYEQLPTLNFILKGGLPATVKAALQLQGIDAGAPRLPMMALDAAGRTELARLMAALSD